jgi:hypothetical protein
MMWVTMTTMVTVMSRLSPATMAHQVDGPGADGAIGRVLAPAHVADHHAVEPGAVDATFKGANLPGCEIHGRVSCTGLTRFRK